MSSLNKVQIIGRLGQDPEMRTLSSGDATVTLSVATSQRWKDKQSGEQREKTEWHRIVLFGRPAEIANQYLRKGSLAYFEGSLETRKWTDQQGVERYTTEIKAQSLQLLDGKDNGGGGAPAQRPARAAAPAPAAQRQAAPAGGVDDDIPF